MNTNPLIPYPFNPIRNINSQYNTPLYLLSPFVERAGVKESKVSAIDCADEHHHRVYANIAAKVQTANRKHKMIKNVVKQRNIEQKDTEYQNKHRDLNTFINNTVKFTQFWDQRILQENKDSIGGSSFINQNQSFIEHYEIDHQLPKHVVHKHNHSLIDNDFAEQQYDMTSANRASITDLNDINHDIEVSVVRNNSNDMNLINCNSNSVVNGNILRDPLTPHNNSIKESSFINKKISDINNIVNNEYGKLNDYVTNKMLNEKEDKKKINRLRVFSINKIAAIKSRQNIQIKNMNKKSKSKTSFKENDAEIEIVVTQTKNFEKQDINKLDSVPKQSKMINDENINDLSFTNAKSRLSVSTAKKQTFKGPGSNKNLFKIEEDNNQQNVLNSGIIKYMDELNKIVYQHDKKESKGKWGSFAKGSFVTSEQNRNNDNTRPCSEMNLEKESWLDLSIQKSNDTDSNHKYEKYINAFSKMCSDRDLESQFLVDI